MLLLLFWSAANYYILPHGRLLFVFLKLHLVYMFVYKYSAFQKKNQNIVSHMKPVNYLQK